MQVQRYPASGNREVNDNNAWWRHPMETFSALLAICAGNSPVTGEFPTKRPVTRSLDVFFICDWINIWVNHREAGDLRRHRAHDDVPVMDYGRSCLHFRCYDTWWLIKCHLFQRFFKWADKSGDCRISLDEYMGVMQTAPSLTHRWAYELP